MAFKHSADADTADAGKWEVSGRIVHETEPGEAHRGAIKLDDGVSIQWLPKSRIRIGEPDRAGVVEVTMPEWLAKEKGYV